MQRFLSRLDTKYFAAIGVVLGLCFAQNCSRKLGPEDSCQFVQNSSQRRVSWKETPVKLIVDSSVPNEYRPAIKSASEKWNKSLGKQIFIISDHSEGSEEPRKDGYSKIYWMEKWEPDRKLEQARTSVYWTGARIFEADIRINHADFKFFTGAAKDSGNLVHLESLIVHELGHVLGLAHDENPVSVMQPHLASGVLRDTPGSIDLSSLACEY